MRIEYRDGLLFASLTLFHGGYRIEVPDVVIDTGATQSLISIDAVDTLFQRYEPGDRLIYMRGIGGSEGVYPTNLVNGIATFAVEVTKSSKQGESIGVLSSGRRSDDEILATHLDQLSWSKFERLLALYFRDQGYEVEETGVGGNDGCRSCPYRQEDQGANCRSNKMEKPICHRPGCHT